MKLDDFKAMWTTDAVKYVLVESEYGYLPMDVSESTPSAVLIDEDDDLAQAVAAKMVESGVPVLDSERFASRFARPSQ